MTRETLDVDILIVGGGPAGLSAALRLAQLQQQDGGDPLSIAVLDKAREFGALAEAPVEVMPYPNPASVWRRDNPATKRPSRRTATR